ncbi:methyltransferase [Amycolatopsis sp. NPDC059021]|uniref:methyltransferase n=1 Tax=Amycolatopsis sp. NPDC059021 TaxID=3346704 RepID=UPI0036703200
MEAQATLRRLLSGAMATHVIGVAADLGLADTIGDGAGLGVIADAHGIPPERMVRLLRAFASLGCCFERAPRVYALTEAGSLLRKDNPGSLLDFAKLSTTSVTEQPWLRLKDSLRTGRPAFDDVFGCSAFEYFAGEPEQSAVFNAAMSQGTRDFAEAAPRYYDFGRYATIADLGGGDGTLLAGILRSAPGSRGILFDLEAGSTGAAENLGAAGVSERCDVVAGDFREAVPQGADLYVIKSALHNWDDDQAAVILGNCRAAMNQGGRVLIADPVLPDVLSEDERLFDPYLMDLHMLVVVGGKERTRSEFETVCARAGLAVTAITPVPSTGLSLIEAEAR